MAGLSDDLLEIAAAVLLLEADTSSGSTANIGAGATRTITRVPWWVTYAHLVTVSEFRAKFRMWPETLCELVSHLTGSHYNLRDQSGWRRCVKTDEAKFICHAACLMVHGTC